MTNRDFCLNTFTAILVLGICLIELSFMLYGFNALKESYGAFASCSGLWAFLVYNSISGFFFISHSVVIAMKLFCSGEKHSGNFLHYTASIYRILTLIGIIIIALKITNECIDMYETKYPLLWQATMNYFYLTIGLFVFGILSLALSCYLNCDSKCCNKKELYTRINNRDINDIDDEII